MSKSTSFWTRTKKFFKVLGPDLITGASDDDPSGIATYSQAIAQDSNHHLSVDDSISYFPDLFAIYCVNTSH